MVDWEKIKLFYVASLATIGLSGILFCALSPRITTKEDRQFFEQTVRSAIPGSTNIASAQYFRTPRGDLWYGNNRLDIRLKDGSRVRYNALNDYLLDIEITEASQTNTYAAGKRDRFDDCDICGWDFQNHWRLHSKSSKKAKDRRQLAQKTFDFYAK
jgi:hypothetical protein